MSVILIEDLESLSEHLKLELDIIVFMIMYYYIRCMGAIRAVLCIPLYISMVEFLIVQFKFDFAKENFIDQEIMARYIFLRNLFVTQH